MFRLARRLFTHVFRGIRNAALWIVGKRRRKHTTREDDLKARLLLSPMESRDHPGNMVGGLALAALGYHMTDPLEVMNLAVGDFAMLGAASSDDLQAIVGDPPLPLTNWLPDELDAIALDVPTQNTDTTTSTSAQLSGDLVEVVGDPLDDFWTIPVADDS
ncbi:MAG: hypothetical protein L0241_02595, partial [Planctomycetia bacterium]|nr:hypothetical protein [Planctomycetia bacterium]